MDSSSRFLIYAADDHPLNRGVLFRQLSATDNSIAVFEDEQSLFHAIKQNKPDLVIFDSEMQGKDMFAEIRELRKQHSKTDLPILMLTKNDSNEYLALGREAGINAFLKKPFEREQLLILVQNFLDFAGREQKNETKQTTLDIEAVKSNLYEDLHDYLGSRLVDLRILLGKVREDGIVLPEIIESSDRILNQATVFLRSKIAGAEELLEMEVNFLPGIHSLLLNRYAAAERRFLFDYTEKEEDFFNAITNPEMRQNLLSFFEEVTTNDLKYGKDESRWHFALQPDGALVIQFLAPSLYTGLNKEAGTGSTSIRHRAEKTGALLEISQQPEYYYLRATLHHGR